MPKPKIYQSIFSKPVIVTTREEAADSIRFFCRDYCLKDSIEKYHCSGYHASICQKVKDQILEDWKRKDNAHGKH